MCGNSCKGVREDVTGIVSSMVGRGVEVAMSCFDAGSNGGRVVTRTSNCSIACSISVIVETRGAMKPMPTQYINDNFSRTGARPAFFDF